MDGIIIVNKEKNMTSRDVVNIISKELNTKRVGHAGTLDPMATGVLVIGIGKYTKLLDLLFDHNKEYIATVLIGTSTDTLDITGNTVNSSEKKVSLDSLQEVIATYKKKYLQEIPLYSAKKVNGMKLYEYARKGMKIELPKKEVEIFDIKLLSLETQGGQQYFKFYAKVSKGTFIRSLINDIGNDMGIPMTMSNLIRTSQGNFKLENCSKLRDDYKLLQAHDIFDYKCVEIDQTIYHSIQNGNKLKLNLNDKRVIFTYLGEDIAIYENTNNEFRVLVMLKSLAKI